MIDAVSVESYLMFETLKLPKTTSIWQAFGFFAAMVMRYWLFVNECLVFKSTSYGCEDDRLTLNVKCKQLSNFRPIYSSI